MTFIICVDKQVLHGARAVVANEAAAAYFEDAGIDPAAAAHAAFVQEGEQQDITEEQGDWAEWWRGAPAAVAHALGVDADQVDVNLDLGR